VTSGTRTGIYFGTTSGVITTLGVIVGLQAGTHSLAAVLAGILIIAVADSLSDALGIHLAQESDPNLSTTHVWEATFSTFAAKLVTALSFALPFILLPVGPAILISIAWGYLIISVLSYRLAKDQQLKPRGVIAEHLVIATVVIIATHAIGTWINDAVA
jgi:VIT1/CCC1 family predicted Fe2+/Mn2+ transporter